MSDFTPRLDGLVPPHLAPRHHKVALRRLSVPVDIGFHEGEIGNPQRLFVDIEVTLQPEAFAATDEVADAWNYDVLRTVVTETVQGRRFNLQETVAREIYANLAARHGVAGLTVRTEKPDIYADAEGVGVTLSSED